jgi:hypothetical protein
MPATEISYATMKYICRHLNMMEYLFIRDLNNFEIICCEL